MHMLLILLVPLFDHWRDLRVYSILGKSLVTKKNMKVSKGVKNQGIDTVKYHT